MKKLFVFMVIMLSVVSKNFGSQNKRAARRAQVLYCLFGIPTITTAVGARLFNTTSFIPSVIIGVGSLGMVGLSCRPNGVFSFLKDYENHFESESSLSKGTLLKQVAITVGISASCFYALRTNMS